MAKIPLTYTGSNTDGLYVLALRNGKEVKLRVKELDCHGGILACGLIMTGQATKENALAVVPPYGSVVNLTF